MAEKKRARQKPDIAGHLQPTEDEIRKRAYEIFRARTSTPGSAVDDWLTAETELREGQAADRRNNR
jgi:hypothetical protein